jgi:hypothetical protein
MVARVMRRTSSLTLAAVLVATVAAGVVSCASGAEVVRSATYGPSFQYIDESRLHDSMWRLAKGVQDLDLTMKAGEELSEVDRQTRVLAILDDMATATSAVSAPGQATNHKNIEMNIDRLQLEIALARRSAETNDYAAAKALPHTCLACHTGTGGGPQR